jgi:hypothetical protein
VTDRQNIPLFDPGSPEFVEPDWTPLLKHPPNELECRCGHVWMGYSKIVPGTDKRIRPLSQHPCPGCGSRTNLRRMSSPPERQNL